MLRFLAVLLMFSLASAVLGDALYKWVDPQGNVHYSDHPMPGAKKLSLPAATTYRTPPVSLPSGQSRDNYRQSVSYTSLTIVAPKDQETLWNVRSVSVSVDLEPGLQPGDTLTISVDGQSKTGNVTSATFDNLERGEHSVAASVSSNGAKVITAPPITFYIQQARQKPE